MWKQCSSHLFCFAVYRTHAGSVLGIDDALLLSSSADSVTLDSLDTVLKKSFLLRAYSQSALAVRITPHAISGLPLELRDAVTAYYPYSLPDFVCPSRAFLIEMSGNVSALTITAFSIQRWLAICFPLKARSACRYRRTMKLICGVWIVGAAGAMPVLAAVKINRLPVPSVDENGDFIDSLPDTADPIPGTEFCAADHNRPDLELGIIHYSFWTSFVIPLVLIIVLYIHIAVTIRKTCNLKSPLLRQHAEVAQRKSAVKMLGK